MTVTCPTCQARGKAPCHDGGHAIAQWHTRRLMAQARAESLEAAKRGAKGAR